jgi:Secretion system C-terminal sorting domain
MKKNYFFLFLCCLFMSNVASAQITILDFESAPKSTTFMYFGSTLEPMLTNTIPNPDKTGINTSANVSDFKKPAASQSWAGAASEPFPTTPVDLTTGGTVCIKVWADHVGNLAMKFEKATDGTPDWVQKVAITETNKWVNLCFDPAAVSLEGPNIASGHIYKKVVLFFDFGEVLTAEKTWYFDDLIVKPGIAGPKKITFNVDMSKYVGTFGKVYASGTFNSWSGTSNEMTDPDGDKVYTTEITAPQGPLEYKFTIDNWAKQEEFNGFETCTISDPSGKFHNRALTVVADKVLPTVCFNSCYKCGDAVKIDFKLGTSSITPSADGIYLVGGGNFDAPGGKHRLQDPDKDGIYTISVERQKGFTSFYSFANGNCPDYSCKENIAGQACANAANFNDRKMTAVSKDTTITTCYGSCSGTTACVAGPKAGKIKFRVDMRHYKLPFKKVYVSGLFNNWAADANELTDADNDKIYEGTVAAVSAGKQEFKFQLDAWAKSEEFKGGEPCTVTSGTFTNRIMEVNGDSTLTAFCYNSCSKCTAVGTNDIMSDDLITIQPTVATDEVLVTFSENFDANTKQINLMALDGRRVATYEVAANTRQQIISVSAMPNGLYLLQAKAGVTFQTAKVVVSH